MQDGSPVAHLEVDGALVKVERPKEARRQDTAVEVVHLRPRTGVEQVNSYQGKRSTLDGAVRNAPPLEGADVGLEVVRRAVARAGGTDMVGESTRPIEVGNRRGFDIQALGVSPVKGRVTAGLPAAKT